MPAPAQVNGPASGSGGRVGATRIDTRTARPIFACVGTLLWPHSGDAARNPVMRANGHRKAVIQSSSWAASTVNIGGRVQRTNVGRLVSSSRV